MWNLLVVVGIFEWYSFFFFNFIKKAWSFNIIKNRRLWSNGNALASFSNVDCSNTLRGAYCNSSRSKFAKFFYKNSNMLTLSLKTYVWIYYQYFEKTRLNKKDDGSDKQSCDWWQEKEPSPHSLSSPSQI